MKLFSYFRSTSSFRVRIALNLKGLTWEAMPVNLLRDGGEQHLPSFRAINPQRMTPVLQFIEAGETKYLSQSLAIMEYLEEAYPLPALLPKGAWQRAKVRSIMQTIACDIQPLGNLRVQQYLQKKFQANETAKQQWTKNWIDLGFSALEEELSNSTNTGLFIWGDSPTLADCCLLPQFFNAKRFGCNLKLYPTIERIVNHSLTISSFIEAEPKNQIDAN